MIQNLKQLLHKQQGQEQFCIKTSLTVSTGQYFLCQGHSMMLRRTMQLLRRKHQLSAGGVTSFWSISKAFEFSVETDHTPLVSVSMTKELSRLLPRIHRFRLRLIRYSPWIMYFPGKDQVTADALSRAAASKRQSEDDIHAALEILPATPARDQRSTNVRRRVQANT